MDDLDLSYNHFTRIPQHLPKNVTRFLIIQCSITRIVPEDFHQFSYIYHLDVDNNPITSVDSSAFAALPDLEELYVEFNKLHSEGWQPCSIIQNVGHQNENLKYLACQRFMMFSNMIHLWNNFEFVDLRRYATV